MFSLSIDLPTAIRHFVLIFGSTGLSFLLVILLTPLYHRFLLHFGLTKVQREKTVAGEAASIFLSLHLKKEGTPTTGGVLIWGTVLLVVLFSILIAPFLTEFGVARFSLLNRNETYLPLFALFSTALLGLFDDYVNAKGQRKSHPGIRTRPKFFWLLALSLLGALWFYYKLEVNNIHVPGLGDITIGPWYIPLFVFVIAASANAVNITDGLDGLAGGLIVIAFTAFGIIAYLQGLLILTAFCGVIVGATFAFLWFNVPPALFYMGDTGALSLGATLGVLAMLTNSVLILPFIAFIFVIETLSVILQLFSKKFFRRKIFLIAPLHHHFEASGWPESQVVMRFWIIGAFMAAFGVILAILSLAESGKVVS